MVVALNLLLLFVFNELTGASEPLVVRRPLVPSGSRGAFQTPSILVTDDVHRVEVLPRDVSSRTVVARGITDIENVVYTQT